MNLHGSKIYVRIDGKGTTFARPVNYEWTREDTYVMTAKERLLLSQCNEKDHDLTVFIRPTSPCTMYEALKTFRTFGQSMLFNGYAMNCAIMIHCRYMERRKKCRNACVAFMATNELPKDVARLICKQYVEPTQFADDWGEDTATPWKRRESK